jgi:hypothetical protein
LKQTIDGLDKAVGPAHLRPGDNAVEVISNYFLLVTHRLSL